MNMLAKSLTAAALAAGVAAGAASAASAKPAICGDITVPVKVRLDAGCFLPDSTPALPPGRSYYMPPAPPAPEAYTWTMPEIHVPESEPADEPAEAPAEEAPTETVEVP